MSQCICSLVFLVVSLFFSLCVLFVPRLFCAVISYIFLPALPWEPERVSNALFAPVPCNASINKSCASHFCLVRVRILWLLAAVNCLSLPFTFASLCGRASLFPPSLPCPFHSQLTQARFHFSVSYSACVKGTVANRWFSSNLRRHK